MNSLKHTLFLCLICAPLLCIGQIKHELKITALTYGKPFTVPSYELILNNRLGIELSYSYFKDQNFVRDTIPFFPVSGDIYLRKNHLPSISAKFYLGKTMYGYGLYVGPILGLQYRQNLDKEYRTKSAIDENGITYLFYGFNFGAKYVYKSHFIAELSLMLGKKDYLERLDSYTFEPRIKLGYRF